METKTKEKFTLRKSKKYKNLVSVGLGLFFVTTGGLFLTTSQADAKEQTPVQEKQEIKDTGSIEVNIKKSNEFKTAINQAVKEGVDIKPKAEKENLGVVKSLNEAKQLEQVAKDKEKAEKENVEKEIQDYKSKKEKYQKELEKVTNENEKRKKENEQIRKDNEQAIIDNERKNKDIDEYNKREEERYKREKAIFDRKMQKAKENSHKAGYLGKLIYQAMKFKSEQNANLEVNGGYDYEENERYKGVTFHDYDFVTATYTNLQNSSYAGRKISKVVYTARRATNLGARPLKIWFFKDPCYGVTFQGEDGNQGVSLEIRFYDEDGNIITFSPEAPAIIGLSSLTSGHITEHGNPIQFWEGITNYNFKFVPINDSTVEEHDDGIYSEKDNLYPEYGSKTTPKNDTPTDTLFYKFGGAGMVTSGDVIKFTLQYWNSYESTMWSTISTEVAGYTELPEYVVPPRYLQKSATKPKPEKELLKEPKKPETPIIRYTEYKYEIKPQTQKKVTNSENQNINNRQTIKGAEVNFNLKTETLPKNREKINVFQITDTLPQNYKINLEKTKSLNKNFLIDYSKGQITFTASKQTLEKINDTEKEITPPAPTIYGNITNDETTIVNEFNLNINNKYKTHSNTVEVKTPEKAESSKDVELDGELEKNTNKEKVEPKKEKGEKESLAEKEEKRKISVKITDPTNIFSEKDRIKTFEEAETGIYKKTGELIEIKKGANLEFEVGKDFEGYIKPFKVPDGYIYNGNGYKIKAKDINNGKMDINIPLEKSHDSLWEFPKPQSQPHIRKKRSLANAPTKEETPNNIIETLKKELKPKEAKAEEIKQENKKQITESINFEIKPKYKTETIEEMNINTIYVLDTSGSRDEIIGKTAELTKKWFDSMKGFKTNIYQYDEKDRLNKFMPKYFNKNGEIIATEKEKESFGRIENPVKQLTKEQGHNLLIFETDFIDQAMSKGLNTYGNWREEKSSRVIEAIDEMINEFYKINKTQTLLILDGANEIFGGNNLPHKVIDEKTGEIKGVVIDSMQDRSTTLTKTVENLVDKYKVEVPQPKKYDIEVEKDKDIDVTLTIDGQQITNSYEIKKPVAETKTLNIQAKTPKELETNKTVTVKIYEVNQGKKEEVGRKTITFKAKKQPNKNSVNGKKVLEGSTLKYKLLWDLDQYQDIAVTKEEINKGFYYIDDYPEEAVDPEPDKIKITDSEGKAVEGIENKIYKNINEAPKEIQNLLEKEEILPKGAFQLFSVKDKENFFRNYVEKGKTLTITTPMQVKRHYVGEIKNKAYQIDFGNGYQTNEVGNKVEKVEPKKENKNKDGQKIDGKKVLEGSTSYYNLTWDLDQYQDIAVTKEEINKGFYYIDDFPEDAVDPEPGNIKITDSEGNKVEGIENKIYKNINEAPKEIKDLLEKEGIKPKGAFQLFSVKDKESFFKNYVEKGKTLTITTPMRVKRHYVGEIKNKAYQIDFGNGYQTNEVGNKVEKVEPKKENKNKDGQKIDGKKVLEGSTSYYNLTWDLDQYQDIAVTKEEINKGFYYIDDYPEEAVDPQIDKVKITDSEGKAVEGIENKIYKNLNEAPKEIKDLLEKEGIKPKGAFQLFSVKDKENFFKNYVEKGKTLTITTPMKVKRHFVGEIKNKAYQIDFGNGYQTNEVGNKVEKVEPKKENKNKDGVKIDGKKVLEGSTSYYNLTWDLDQYKDIAVTKEEINKGFYYIDDYPEEAVDPEPGNIKITDSEGKAVEGIENKIYKNINEAPKELQNLLAKEGIKPKGAFQLFSVKDKESFFKNYVEKGKTLTITTPMRVKRHFVGEIKNKAYQIDFGNGYQTNEVGNKVEKVEPKKDVELDGEIIENGGEVELNKTFNYRLRGAIIPENRGTKLEDYEFIDDYDEIHDEYLGNYRVILTDDVNLKDGKTIKKGEDITNYTEQKINKEQGKVEIKIKPQFLDKISDNSKFSAQALLPMKRIKDGEVENTYINKINGVETKSNTIKTKTKPLPKTKAIPKKEEKEKPQEKALPKTGAVQKQNTKQISLITLIGLGTLFLRRKRKINK